MGPRTTQRLLIAAPRIYYEGKGRVCAAMVSARRLVMERPWLLPAVVAICFEGARSVGSLATTLSVPRRLASSLFRQLVHAGFIEASGVSLLRVSGECDIIVRRGYGYYVTVIGDTVIAARPLKRRVKWFTVPLEYVVKGYSGGGKIEFRVSLVRRVLGIDN